MSVRSTARETGSIIPSRLKTTRETLWNWFDAGLVYLLMETLLSIVGSSRVCSFTIPTRPIKHAV